MLKYIIRKKKTFSFSKIIRNAVKFRIISDLLKKDFIHTDVNLIMIKIIQDQCALTFLLP